MLFSNHQDTYTTVFNEILAWKSKASNPNGHTFLDFLDKYNVMDSRFDLVHCQKNLLSAD